MFSKSSKEGQQSSTLAIIIIAGMTITYVLTSAVVKLAKQEAFSTFESKIEQYISSLDRHITNSETAARDLYAYTKVVGNQNIESFRHLVSTNSYLNLNSVYVGLTYAVTEETKSAFSGFVDGVYGDSYQIRFPQSQLGRKQSSSDQRSQFPLFYSWSPNQTTIGDFEGLDIGAEPAVHDFLTASAKADAASVILLPPFPELDQGNDGLIMMAYPFRSTLGFRAIFIKIIDFRKVLNVEARKQGLSFENFKLELLSSWGNEKHQVVISEHVADQSDEDYLPDFLYPNADMTFSKRYGVSNWTYDITALRSSVKPDLRTAYITALVCLLLTFLFSIISYLQGLRAKRVSEIVERRTRALKEAHDELEEHYRLLQNLNKDVEEARKSAELANKAKSEFLATMSHELRTPLNAILGFSQLLSEEALGAIGDARYVEYARDIYSSGSHLLGLINDILDLAKLEAGKINIEHKPLRIQPLLERVCSLVEQQVSLKKLDLITDVSADLPQIILGDELRLRQILINLCTNAVKFTHKGAVTIRLLPRRFKDGRDGWVMEVEDTGIGIPDEKQATLFDRFTQVDTALSRRHGGVGLGLAICRELVDRMSGTISVRSTPGVGTTFRVHLPLEVSDDDVIADDRLI